jgi:hypothetical protein
LEVAIWNFSGAWKLVFGVLDPRHSHPARLRLLPGQKKYAYPLFTFALPIRMMRQPAEKLIMPPASQPVDKIKLWPQNQKQKHRSPRRNPRPRKRSPPRRSSRPLTAVSFGVTSGETDFLSLPPMKLCQGQTWKQGQQYIRIVRLERLEVEYKSMVSLTTKEGAAQVTSKKDFCRLLKGAHLLSPEKKPATARKADGPATSAK